MLQHVRRVKYRLKLKHTWAWCIDWRSCSKSLILWFFFALVLRMSQWALCSASLWYFEVPEESDISDLWAAAQQAQFSSTGPLNFSPRWPSPGKEGELNHHSRSLGGWLYGSTPGKRQSFWLIHIEFSLFSWEETLQFGDASVNLRHVRYCRMISSGKTENGIGTPSPSRVELSRPNHPSYEFLELVPWQPLLWLAPVLCHFMPESFQILSVNPAGSLYKRRLLKWLFHDQHFKIMW